MPVRFYYIGVYLFSYMVICMLVVMKKCNVSLLTNGIRLLVVVNVICLQVSVVKVPISMLAFVNVLHFHLFKVLLVEKVCMIVQIL